ncbi:MAG: hypothetical protein JNK87_24615 [Bryobacterales bacterium]|nr:hypothetical protein [Bryobacterales bacterium]
MERAAGYKRGGRAFALRALGLLRYLAHLGADRRLAPTHGRAGPGPIGDSAIQASILAAIRNNTPRLRALFQERGGRGVEAAALAAIAARAGERLYSDDELRAALAEGEDPVEAAELAVLLSYVTVDDHWASWLRAYVSVPKQASIALAAWCLLAQAGDVAAEETGDAIGRLSGKVNIDHYALWDLFDQQVALQAQTYFLRHCQASSFALQVAK